MTDGMRRLDFKDIKVSMPTKLQQTMFVEFNRYIALSIKLDRLWTTKIKKLVILFGTINVPKHTQSLNFD